MERILVCVDARHGAWEAWARAISLAKRIDAKVYALLVLPLGGTEIGTTDTTTDRSVRERLELLIELAKSDGIPIDYFISEGSYEEEVIRFANQHKITLIVAEPPRGDNRHSDREFASFEKIRHRIRCRAELVSPRKTENFQA
jgi:nucleotide-binding universal stress UspA family protein